MTDQTIKTSELNIGDITYLLLKVHHRDDTPTEVKQLCTDAYLLMTLMACKMAKAGILNDAD